MTDTSESPATALCKSCGLCCSGHLFVWVKLRSSELDGAESLGLKVFREPRQRGFNLPCPLWNGACTIYTSPHYPRFCGTYKCKLLKKVLDEVTPLTSALKVVQQTKNLIHAFDLHLPASSNPNFRERLVALMENESLEPEYQAKARQLLDWYEAQFGVNDLIDFYSSTFSNNFDATT